MTNTGEQQFDQLRKDEALLAKALGVKPGQVFALIERNRRREWRSRHLYPALGGVVVLAQMAAILGAMLYCMGVIQ